MLQKNIKFNYKRSLSAVEQLALKIMLGRNCLFFTSSGQLPISDLITISASNFSFSASIIRQSNKHVHQLQLHVIIILYRSQYKILYVLQHWINHCKDIKRKYISLHYTQKQDNYTIKEIHINQSKIKKKSYEINVRVQINGTSLFSYAFNTLITRHVIQANYGIISLALRPSGQL